MENVTQIRGYDEFCIILKQKLRRETMQQIQLYIRSYIQSRRANGEPKKELENSLTEIVNFHMGTTYEKGKMVYLATNRFQLMSRLSQTYLVDSISRAIDYRLRFVRYHQKDIFGIMNDEGHENTDESGNTGEKTFLSQSCHGFRRYLRSLAKNALALVSEYGRPSLFVTLTCNLNWPEILKQLLPSQTAFDRGDIVCQVFHRKLEIVLRNIRCGKYFKIRNKQYAYHKIQFEVRIIEYQRRGLPHAHLVSKFMDNDDMPRYEDKKGVASSIDYHITAAYPTTASDEEPLEVGESYEEDTTYAAVVKSHMLHNCFPETNGGCKNEKNLCYLGFDANIVADTTTFDDRGYPQYRRSTVKSLCVVPHNRELLKDWNHHANVEFAGSTYTVIYLYKYLFKRSKKVKMRLTNADDVRNDDEINLYLRGRYLCSMDCYWRILGHETYPAPSPSVRIVKIVSEQRTNTSLEDGKVPDIIVYFSRPPALYNMKYTELFNMYTWTYNRPARFVENQDGFYIINIRNNIRNIYLSKRSDRNPSITRLEVISITAGELFFLRLILLNYPKCSYADCLQFNNRTYRTYQESAVAAGIVRDNDEVYSCFEEAEHFQDMTPTELRTLFVISTLQGFPTLRILNENRFRELMYDDYLHNYSPPNHSAAWNDLLCDFSRRFESDGKNMKDYGLPEPESMKTELEIERNKYDQNEQLEIYNKLCQETPSTIEQQQIFDEIIRATERRLAKIYYIQGQAGSGKSTLPKKIISFCRSQGKLCARCASTGLAATLYEGFETAHSSLFKFPVIEDDEREVDSPVECNLSKSPSRLEYLREVDVTLLDEFPSCDRAAHRAFSRFEGKVVITMGDIRQIAPVLVNGDKLDVIFHSIPSSPLWEEFTINKLSINMRLKQNQATTNEEDNTETNYQRLYGEMIIKIGNGTYIPEVMLEGYVSNPSEGVTTIELPDCRRMINRDDAIKYAFPPPFNIHFSKRAILAGTIEDVDDWNQEVQNLNLFPLISLASHEELAESNDPYNILRNMLTDDVLNNYSKNGVPPHVLRLKVNDTCIFLRKKFEQERRIDKRYQSSGDCNNDKVQQNSDPRRK